MHRITDYCIRKHLFNGGKIARTCWPSNTYLKPRSEHGESCFIFVQGKEECNWTPSFNQMMSEDWEIIPKQRGLTCSETKSISGNSDPSKSKMGRAESYSLGPDRMHSKREIKHYSISKKAMDVSEHLIEHYHKNSSKNPFITGVDEVTFVPIDFSFDRIDSIPRMDFPPGIGKTKCECGVDKAGGGIHSSWCPKGDKR